MNLGCPWSSFILVVIVAVLSDMLNCVPVVWMVFIILNFQVYCSRILFLTVKKMKAQVSCFQSHGKSSIYLALDNLRVYKWATCSIKFFARLFSLGSVAWLPFKFFTWCYDQGVILVLIQWLITSTKDVLDFEKYYNKRTGVDIAVYSFVWSQFL